MCFSSQGSFKVCFGGCSPSSSMKLASRTSQRRMLALFQKSFLNQVETNGEKQETLLVLAKRPWTKRGRGWRQSEPSTKVLRCCSGYGNYRHSKNLKPNKLWAKSLLLYFYCVIYNKSGWDSVLQGRIKSKTIERRNRISPTTIPVVRNVQQP